ncbi:MAG: hypothetical protein WC786_04920 [Patescibacteria group bacterium]|jgi:hypothetical protein
MSLRQPSVGTYPKALSFWNEGTDQVTIINPEDFPREAILKGLDLRNHPLAKGFGNCDETEAYERIEVMRFLGEHPGVRKAIIQLANTYSVPTSQERFQTYYDPAQPATPFWAAVHTLCDELGPTAALPKRLRIFAGTIQSFLGLEADERLMATAVAEILDSTAVLEGLLEFEVSIDSEERFRSFMKVGKPNSFDAVAAASTISCKHYATKVFHGHRTFSFALSEARMKKYPKWFEQKWNPWRWIARGIRQAWIDWSNKRQEVKASRPMVITQSKEVLEDLVEALPRILANNEKLYRSLHSGTILTVYFTYGKYQDDSDGLQIRITDARMKKEQTNPKEFFFEFVTFAGYSRERLKLIDQARRETREAIQRVQTSAADASLRSELIQADPIFFTTSLRVPSPKTDLEHRWKSVGNLYQTRDLAPTYNAMVELQVFCHSHANILGHMCDILSRYTKRAKELHATVSFPEIVINGHENVVEFEELYPLHLGGALKGNVVPINGLPPVNGTMIGLTGTHGGGKTVTEHTLVANIYLAMSGLPILGQRFRLNCKTHLGMVFIEGVSGQSVCQLLIDKTASVFKAIDKIPGRNVILVLDELGSATQEKDGSRVALLVLKALYERQVSLLFSTQIMDVAVAAEK